MVLIFLFSACIAYADAGVVEEVQKEAGPVNVIINPGFEADDAPVSRVDPSMGQRVQEALDAAVAEFKVQGRFSASGTWTEIRGSGPAALRISSPENRCQRTCISGSEASRNPIRPR